MSTILVVEASAICRESMAVILERRGHKVLRAGDGLEALGLLRNHEPDAIVLDLALPGADGLTVLQTMRGDPRHKTRPVVVLTAATDRKWILKARELGVQEYLLKTSFTVEQMLARLTALLEAGRTATRKSA